MLMTSATKNSLQAEAFTDNADLRKTARLIEADVTGRRTNSAGRAATVRFVQQSRLVAERNVE